MHYLIRLALFSFLITCLNIVSVKAQGFSFCGRNMLESAIEAHNSHIYRLQNKFDNIWYYQGDVPGSTKKEVKLGDVENYLNVLKPRKAAVLFFAQDAERLCAWLIQSSGDGVYSEVEIMDYDVTGLQSRINTALNVRSINSERVPIRRRGFIPTPPRPSHPAELESAVQYASNLLFQREIAEVLTPERIDTLIVVPIGLYETKRDPVKDRIRRMRAENLVAAIGTMPLSIMKVRGEMLLDIASVVIAPGFHIFTGDPRITSRKYKNPIIVGDPRNEGDPDWIFPELPGARKEALAIATLLKAKPLIGKAATKDAVIRTIKEHSATTNLIHLATHGISSATHPLDGSFLLMSNGTDYSKGRFTARDISKTFRNQHRLTNRPTVVLSACESGRGKDFSVGTTGLARAWQWVGASQVVMSLWNVDDEATRRLMTRFIEVTRKMPTDKALQKAMQEIRNENNNPVYWAGFTIFGEPQL